VLVVLNMSAGAQTLRAPLAGQGVQARAGQVLIGTVRAAHTAVALDAIALQPFEVVVAAVGPGR